MAAAHWVASAAAENAHEDGIWAVAWSRNGQLVTGSCDELVQTFMVHGARAEKKHALRGHTLGVNGVAVAASG